MVNLISNFGLRGLSSFYSDFTDFWYIPKSAALRPILAAYQNFSPFFYFIAEMAKNRVLVSLDACSLPNQILTFSISFINPIDSHARRVFVHSSTLEYYSHQPCRPLSPLLFPLAPEQPVAQPLAATAS
jgi:hypothetical protein